MAMLDSTALRPQYSDNCSGQFDKLELVYGKLFRNTCHFRGNSHHDAYHRRCGQAGSVSQEVTDARQEAQIWTTYALNTYLRASDLQVSVQDGKATLTGVVEDSVSKELAKEIALGVNGVKEVDDQIVVSSDAARKTSSPERSYGEKIDDATITAAIKSKLLWSKYTADLATNVETKSGQVTVSGVADSAAAKDLAGNLANNTRGVVSVDNRLTVSGAKTSLIDSAKLSVDRAGRDISDGWITTKVKSMFMYSKNVTGADITVSTNSGVVTLTGKVHSGAERSLAIELAQNVMGVKNVHAKSLTF
jgi:hyperosmotically inducible periplasmic protein